MKEICIYEECTGCTACVNVCPRSCIQMAPDNYGFLRPVINQELCIDCGRCVKVCPNNKEIEKSYPLICYASWSLDEIDRETSTSGGISSVLSSYIVKQGGVVYGTAYQDGVVKHIRVSKKEDLYKLKGSKYVQSYVGDVFTFVIQDIQAGKIVLFWGTPCQTMGLKSFIENKRIQNTSHIIYGDIICHGVPSQKILGNYIKDYLKIKEQISDITFREPEGYFLTLKGKDKILYRKGFPKDKYLTGFQYGLFHRDCCYQCHYASSDRISDITIGDFWGLGETSYPKKKVSVILCNTSRGKEVIDSVRDKLFLEERPVEEAVQGNTQLQHPSKKHEFYSLFHKLYPKYGYNIAINLSLMKFYIKHFVYEFLYRNKSFQKWYYRKSLNK